MSDSTTLEEDRKRAEAFEALALPVQEPGSHEGENQPSSSLEIHDGEVFADQSPDEDILDGLDRPERGETNES